MFEYCFKYASFASDYYSDPVEAVAPDPRVTKVIQVINKLMMSLETSVYFTGDYTKEQAQTCADDVALWALNQLSRYTNRYFGDLKFQGGSLITTNDDGTQSIIDYGSAEIIRVGLSADFDVGYKPEEQARIIKTALEQGRKPVDGNFAKYREALACDDTVARFMNLYRILMAHHNENVTSTDEYIKRYGVQLGLDLNIKARTYTHRGNIVNVSETVFTRLRNEMTHNPTQITTSTCVEMGRNLGGMMALVKKYLEEHAPVNS